MSPAEPCETPLCSVFLVSKTRWRRPILICSEAKMGWFDYNEVLYSMAPAFDTQDKILAKRLKANRH
jgi:hypothetical protein